jgi:hypothetical protein
MTQDDAPAASQPPRPATGQCRVADLEILRAGGDLALVYARDSGAAGFYRADVVDLLVSCRHFRTLDEHARAYAGAEAAGARQAPLLRELHRLLRAGLLISRDELRLPVTPHAGSLPPISAVGFPTCDRVDVLRRAVSGYARNCSRAGREVEYVIVDDSVDPGARERYLSMLAELESSQGIGIRYAGVADKAAFAAKLVSAGGIPEDVVRFGCLGDRGVGVTIGANRNALMLDTVGQRIISVDDDTVCKLAVPPGQLDGLDLDSGGNPLQLWFFASRQASFGAVDYVEEDLLALHERYLGQPLAPLLAAGSPSYELADPALLRRVHAAPGRIRVTTNGTVGDCGWDNPDFFLFQQGATLARLNRSQGDYELARSSRDMIQSAVRTTISGRPDPKFAICLGLDNTELLPPFPPVGRAEEVGFGAMLSACFGNAYAAHLPWLVQHDPVGRRQFSAADPFAINLGSWLPSCLSRFDAGLTRSPAERLRRLGGFLIDLAQLPAAEFDEFVRLGVWDSMSALIGGLEEQLDGPVPDYWARDVQRYIVQIRRSASAPVGELYAGLGGRDALQRLLERFGQLLIWWPAILDAARGLAAAGERLTRPVSELR